MENFDFLNSSDFVLVKTDTHISILEHDDITIIASKALKAIGNTDRLVALNIADKVLSRLQFLPKKEGYILYSDLQQMMKFVLYEVGFAEAAKHVDVLFSVPS